jgi:hypothetical protein
MLSEMLRRCSMKRLERWWNRKILEVRSQLYQERNAKESDEEKIKRLEEQLSLLLSALEWED